MHDQLSGMSKGNILATLQDQQLHQPKYEVCPLPTSSIKVIPFPHGVAHLSLCYYHKTTIV